MSNLITPLPCWGQHRGLVHGYTTRALGNLSYRTAERAEADARRIRLADELKIEAKSLFSIPLGHTNRIAVLLGKSFLSRVDQRGYLKIDPNEVIDRPVLTPEIYRSMAQEDQVYADGVLFDEPGVFSLIITADCAAVGFFDPERGVCGNAHIGLLGAVNQLAQGMVGSMVESFGSDPRHIEVVIFPCIRQCHYDTSNSLTWQRIKGEVMARYGEENPLYSSGHFDLPGFIRQQLVEAGIGEERIFDADQCTVCHYEQFFSHVGAGSAEGQAVEGRFGAVVGMRG